jgi:hypothetical protein
MNKFEGSVGIASAGDEDGAKEYIDTEADSSNWRTYEFTNKYVDASENWGGNSPSFRLYDNPVWRDGHEYDAITQGCMSMRAKCHFGMQNLKLQRSHKYGNLCRDCMRILTLAPGLLRRNVSYTFNMGGDLKIVSDPKTDFAKPSAWWDQLIKETGQHAVDINALHMDPKRVRAMDPARKAEHDARVQKAGEAIKAHFMNHHWKWTTDSMEEKPVTLIDPPTISTQPGPYRDPPKAAAFAEGEGGSAVVDETLAAIRRAMDTKQPISVKDQSSETFQMMLRTIQQRFERDHAFYTPTKVRQFDGTILRIEYRNVVVIVWKTEQEGVTHGPLDGGDPKTITPANMVAFDEKEFGEMTVERIKKIRAHLHKIGDPDKDDGRDHVMSRNCLVTRMYNPNSIMADAVLQKLYRIPVGHKERQTQAWQDAVKKAKLDLGGGAPYTVDIHFASVSHSNNGAYNVSHPVGGESMWRGDKWLLQLTNMEGNDRQIRYMRQSRLLITYSLHRPILNDMQGRAVLEKMNDAVTTLFGNDRWLAQLLVFGQYIQKKSTGKDGLSNSEFVLIKKTNKVAQQENFYGSSNDSSYTSDRYSSHINRVGVFGGVEIGPIRKHPHFHVMLSIEHFSYVQIDYFKMKAYLEIMFRGVETPHGWGETYKLPTLDNLTDYYGDNENPYVDIQVYPQDNWRDILEAYVSGQKGPSNGTLVELMAQRGTTPLNASYEKHLKEDFPNIFGGQKSN